MLIIQTLLMLAIALPFSFAGRSIPSLKQLQKRTYNIIQDMNQLSGRLQPEIDNIANYIHQLSNCVVSERPKWGALIHQSYSNCHQHVKSCSSSTPTVHTPPARQSVVHPTYPPVYSNGDCANAAGIYSDIIRRVHSCSVGVGQIIHLVPSWQDSLTSTASDLDSELSSYLEGCNNEIPNLTATTSSNCGRYIDSYMSAVQHQSLWGFKPYNEQCHFPNLFSRLGYRHF